METRSKNPQAVPKYKNCRLRRDFKMATGLPKWLERRYNIYGNFFELENLKRKR